MHHSALIDTGAVLALLDRTDRWHNLCVKAFRQLRLPLLISEAVLTELFHLVGDDRREMEAAWASFAPERWSRRRLETTNCLIFAI